MTAIESGTKFWDTVFRKLPEALEFSERARKDRENALLVHPLPAVRRLVFIATPQ